MTLPLARRFSCPPSFRGAYCQFRMNACDSSPCLHGGRCESSSTSAFRCVCSPGYVGQNCETLADMCHAVPSVCKNGATCRNIAGRADCVCPAGWTGEACDLPTGQTCEGYARIKGLSGPKAVCSNQGTCMTTSSTGFRCVCDPGYQGSYCQLPINECATNPCQNGARCEDKVGYYTCKCRPGYEGEKTRY